ncbi:MAG: hypothetical protein FJZ58_07510 [Chlamydiae bacterium]|nr:hypothetical protein [Chlamydiota bacterium]
MQRFSPSATRRIIIEPAFACIGMKKLKILEDFSMVHTREVTSFLGKDRFFPSYTICVLDALYRHPERFDALEQLIIAQSEIPPLEKRDLRLIVRQAAEAYNEDALEDLFAEKWKMKLFVDFLKLLASYQDEEADVEQEMIDLLCRQTGIGICMLQGNKWHLYGMPCSVSNHPPVVLWKSEGKYSLLYPYENE